MNKKEMNIILTTYKEAYNAQEILGFDKADTLRTLKFMIDSLGLEKQRYEIENDVIAERDHLNITTKEMYQIIFETFEKYNVYVNYDLDEIEMYYDNLQFKMTQEENKCHQARINYIISNKAA